MPRGNFEFTSGMYRFIYLLNSLLVQVAPGVTKATSSESQRSVYNKSLSQGI